MQKADGTIATDKPGTTQGSEPRKWNFWHRGNDPDADATTTLPYWQLFRYSTSASRAYLIVAVLAAMAHGAMLPILTVVYGQVIDDISAIYQPSESAQFVPLNTISSFIASTTRTFLILAFSVSIVSFLQLFCALRSANALSTNLRTRFVSALLRQPSTFFDSNPPGALVQLVASDIALVQGGVGDKLVTAVQYITTVVAALVVGFLKGWQLTLVILAVTPVLVLSGYAFAQATTATTSDSLGAYAAANAIAAEVLSHIRTVVAFSAQRPESSRYDAALTKAYKSSAKAAVISGAGLATAVFFILLSYALAFWFGALKVKAGEMAAGDVISVFFALSLGTNSLGTAGPVFKSFTQARAAAPRIYDVIEAPLVIDPIDNETGDIIAPEELQGRITFEAVDFDYPNRHSIDILPSDEDDGECDAGEKESDENNDKISSADDKANGHEEGTDHKPVLQRFSLDIPAGSSEALVGHSGSGKSTVARLIQRLYDPTAGRVLLDGRDLRTLNVRWLRAQIGVVSQTPSLFSLSIRDNIGLGCAPTFSRDSSGTVVMKHEASLDEVIEAAKLANAHDFITRLPNGYDTILGGGGDTLSGGQLQRMCIARAIVRNPRILLLDESTAALDTESEHIVQEALERAFEGRTTLTIAHRLSTVRHADAISCVAAGTVTERGPHDELISKQGGFYRTLFEAQDVQKAAFADEKAAATAADDASSAVTRAQQQELRKIITHRHSFSEPGPDKDEDADDEETKGNEKKKEKDVDKGIFMRTVRHNAPDWLLLLLGCFGALIVGVVWPLASVVMTQIVEILAQPSFSMSDVRFWILGFVVLASVAFIANMLQHVLLGLSGERLTRRLRSAAFRTLLAQEIAFFDTHQSGELVTLLASDAALAKGLTGDLLAVALNVFSSLVTGIVIAFTACWQVTLIVLAVIPGIALSAYFEKQSSAGLDSGARKEFARANNVLVEALSNIDTVRAIGKEHFFLQRFVKIVTQIGRSKLRKDAITAVAFGFSEFCLYLIWFATYRSGGDFISNGTCSFRSIQLSSLGLLFAAIQLGNVSVFAPDISASSLGATAVYRLLDRVPAIVSGPDDPDAEASYAACVKGSIEADKLYFEYPSRPHVPVLRRLSIAAAPGDTVALVGGSGSGKSTVIALLQRLYDARTGSLRIDDEEISLTRTPREVRAAQGLVQQMPALFNRSVFENIAYGLPNGAPATRAAVELAAKEACAHDFITALPQGYDTPVGERGDALSGGQRQRVAIARALVRNPRILLLDEATSALDYASERAVQKALDSASKGRTTVVVAHRLSTIRNATRICAVQDGRVVEVGTHEELLQKDGVYAKLVEDQLGDV